jgi:hypothetical protein
LRRRRRFTRKPRRVSNSSPRERKRERESEKTNGDLCNNYFYNDVCLYLNIRKQQTTRVELVRRPTRARIHSLIINHRLQIASFFFSIFFSAFTAFWCTHRTFLYFSFISWSRYLLLPQILSRHTTHSRQTKKNGRRGKRQHEEERVFARRARIEEQFENGFSLQVRETSREHFFSHSFSDSCATTT